MRATKPKKPTIFQTKILAAIAHSPLMRTYSADRKTIWALQNGREISDKCAAALIRNGWVRPQRDGLGFCEDSQTYTAIVPAQSAANHR